MFKAKQNIKVTSSTDIDKMFNGLALHMKNKTMRLALSRASRVVVQKAKQLVPVGDPRHDPEAESLKNSIGSVIREYKGGTMFVAYVGPTTGTKGTLPGAHAHLIEYGHKVRSRGPYRKGQPPLSGRSTVAGRRFMKRASISTRAEQQREVERTLAEALQKQTTITWR